MPTAVLLALLQRMPCVATAFDGCYPMGSQVGSVIKAVVVSFAAMGVVDSMAGATVFALDASTPSPATGTVGSQIVATAFQLSATPPTQNPPQSWTISGTIPPGLKFGSAQTFITAAPGSVNVTTPALFGTPTAAGSYTINLQAWEDTDGTGIVSSTFVYQIDIAASPNAPAFTTQPVSVRVTGGRVALVAVASNSPAYQWWWNGTTVVTGATDPILLVQDAVAAAGSYTCVATNSAGSATSNAATLAAVSTSNPGRLTNLSCRAQVGTGADIMTAGFVIGGAGTSGLQPVLVRGSGPALGVFGLLGLLPDPKLTLNNTSASPNGVVATNAGWGGSSAIADEAAALGAFSWGTSATPDSALLESLPGDNYTAQIAGASGDTGLALIEVYDATATGTYTLTTPRLVNLSALIQVGTGANVVFAGFVIGGSSAKTVLIRASGPALASAPFDLPGTLSDPQLTLTNTSVTPNSVITVNTGWRGDPEINSVADSVGAFEWSPASADSAILITLPPGNYTAGVAGANKDSGLSLIELYEVQ
jgi:hypothetical protein